MVWLSCRCSGREGWATLSCRLASNNRFGAHLDNGVGEHEGACDSAMLTCTGWVNEGACDSAMLTCTGGSMRAHCAERTGHSNWRSCLMVSLAMFAVGTATTPTAACAQATSQDTTSGDEHGAIKLASNGDVTLTVGGYVQVDGRWISGSVVRQPDGLLLRRARLVFDAALKQGWHLRLQPDFGQGRVVVQDAYAGWARGTTTVRAGRFRPAFGTERVQSSSTLLFPERSIVNSLMPSRSFGAQIFTARAQWRFALGAFRTPIGSDAPAVDTDGDVNAIAGTGHDFLVRATRMRTWSGRDVEAQVGMLAGREQGTIDAPALTRLLSVAQQPVLAFRNDGSDSGTVRAAGARQRFSAGVQLGGRRSLVSAEGALLRQRVERAGVVVTPVFGAATLRLARTWNGVRSQLHEVMPSTARGALDVGVRAGLIAAWGDGLASSVTRTSATHAQTGGLAVSWVPTRLTRMTVAYDLTVRRPAGTSREHSVLARWQQGF